MHALDPRPQVRRRGAGQALVEFALILPLFLLLIFAIIDFGYYMFVSISVSHAARAGVRLAAMNKSSCDVIKQTVMHNAVGVSFALSEVAVVAVPHDATIPGSPPTVSVAVTFAHRMFASNFYRFETLPIRSSFKSIVTTWTGKETISFSCP